MKTKPVELPRALRAARWPCVPSRACLITAVCANLAVPVAGQAQTLGANAVPLATAPAAAYGKDVRAGQGQFQGHPNADDVAGIADRQRKMGHLATSLHLATRVRDYAPDNRQAIQTELSSLSNLGAAHKAHSLALTLDTGIDRNTFERLRADVAAANLRDAVAERQRIDRLYRYSHRNDPLLAVLPELDANLAAFPSGSTAYIRTRRDRIYLLRQLGRMPEAVTEYQHLLADDPNPPPYVRRAVADAYLDLRKPATAARLYKQLIDDNPRPPVELQMAYYYALIESEQYKQAAELIARLDRTTPIWRYRPAGSSDPAQPNWERVEVDQLLVWDAIYRNHEGEGSARAQRLFEAAPASPDLINTYATSLRWRGNPGEARRQTALAAAYAPQDKDTRLNQANNARDLEHYDRWRSLIGPLYREFPRDTLVRRSVAQLNDRNRPSIEATSSYGSSNGGQAINGTEDLETQVRLNSPWTGDGYRAYIEHYYRYGDFDGGDASFNRLGFGGEWRWDRKNAWATVSNDKLTGNDAGLQVGWSQWLNDHWRYQLMADTYSTETPLRAERAGSQGRYYEGQLDWRANESTSANITAGVLDINDGNTRSLLSGSFSQRVQASAHHQTRAIAFGGFEHNDQPGGPYFNPNYAETAGLAVEHDWLTWRFYDRSFTQNFRMAADSEWQTGQNAAPGYDFLYQHSWALSRTWSLNYGIGWGSHEYDGTREDRTVGVFGFSGVF